MDRALDDTLSEIESAVRSDEEKSEFEIMKNRLNTERMQRQSQRDARFIELLSPHRKRLESLSSHGEFAAIEQLENVVGEIEVLLSRNESWVDGREGISRLIRENARNLIKKANAKISELTKSNEASIRLRTLKNELGNLNTYAVEVATFANRYSDQLNSADFKQTSTEEQVWLGFQRWQSLARELGSIKVAALTPNQASIILDKLASANRKLKLAALQSDLKELSQKLQTAKSATPVNPSLARRLKGTFEQASFAEIFLVDRGGQRYYLAESFDPSSDRRFKYWKKSGGTQSSTFKQDTDKFGKAPHCERAKLIVDLIANSKPEEFEKLVIDMLDVALEKSNDNDDLSIDPLVQCEFADQILLFAKYSVPSMKTIAEEQRNALKADQLVGNQWKVGGEVSDEVRSRAINWLNEMRNLVEKKRKELVAEQEIQSSMTAWSKITKYRIVGLIYRVESNWVVDLIKKPDAQTPFPLYCLIPNATEGTSMKEIGSYENGVLSKPVDASMFRAGRPVYILDNEKQ